MCILLVSYILTRYLQTPCFQNPFATLFYLGYIWMFRYHPPYGMLKLTVPVVSNQGWGPILVQVVAREPRFVVPHDGLARILSRREHLLICNPNNRVNPNNRANTKSDFADDRARRRRSMT